MRMLTESFPHSRSSVGVQLFASVRVDKITMLLEIVIPGMACGWLQILRGRG